MTSETLDKGGLESSSFRKRKNSSKGRHSKKNSSVRSSTEKLPKKDTVISEEPSSSNYDDDDFESLSKSHISASRTGSRAKARVNVNASKTSASYSENFEDSHVTSMLESHTEVGGFDSKGKISSLDQTAHGLRKRKQSGMSDEKYSPIVE